MSESGFGDFLESEASYWNTRAREIYPATSRTDERQARFLSMMCGMWRLYTNSQSKKSTFFENFAESISFHPTRLQWVERIFRRKPVSGIKYRSSAYPPAQGEYSVLNSKAPLPHRLEAGAHRRRSYVRFDHVQSEVLDDSAPSRHRFAVENEVTSRLRATEILLH